MVSSSGRMPVERVGFVALIFAAVLYLSGGSGGTGGYASARQLDEVQLSLSGTNGAPFPGHILVTGGAGFIGSHATLRLLEDGYAVTIVDNYSRGNRGAIETLRKLAPRHKLRVVDGDLGVTKDLERAFGKHKVDAVIHFAAIAYVGESVSQPLAYYRNVTVNTVGLLEAMKRHDVRKLVYSSTCATYGNPDVLPITEKTPTVPINPYGKSKLYSEDAIRDYANANKGKFILTLVRAISMMTLCFVNRLRCRHSAILQRLRIRPTRPARRVPTAGVTGDGPHQRRVFRRGAREHSRARRHGYRFSHPRRDLRPGLRSRHRPGGRAPRGARARR